VTDGLVWAKVRKVAGQGHHGVFHAWRESGPVCAQARRVDSGIAKLHRLKEPYRSCKDCKRILGGDPRIIPRHPLAVA
jgi:hypothetical protein